MPITFEAATWDGEQLKEEIACRLPSGWSFDINPDLELNRWVIIVYGAQEEEAWKSVNITAQLALLEALGWLEARHHPVSDSSPWFRKRGELNPARVHEATFSKVPVIEDPPDLDPKEVDAVYSRRSHKP